MVKATVTAVMSPSLQDRQTILLTRRTVEPFKDHWCFPGGHIDAGESALDAVQREAEEEAGLELHAPVFFGYCDEIFPELHFHAVVLMFYASASGALRPQPAEVSDIGWFSLQQARSLSLAFNHKDVLDRYEKLLETL